MRYRRERLATPTRSGTQRAIASVNRETALLRRTLNVAVREGWILRNPFNAGESLISLADERKRERILTRDEEVRLLAACVGSAPTSAQSLSARSTPACARARS